MNDDPSDTLSDQALAFIVRLHSGAATRDDRRNFAEWRQRSAAHEAAAREAEAIWGDAADLHQDDATQTVQPGRKPRGPGGGKLFGMLLLAGITGSLAVWSTGGWTRWTADEATGVAQTRSLTLADGTRVTLNARSAIDVAMSANGRRVTLLEGEAFFEVARDPVRPFAVRADGLVVTARGTAFDVDKGDGGGIEVAVAEHAVQLNPRVGRAVDLAAGRRASVDAGGRIAAVGAVDTKDVASWREGLLVAENKPLGDIVAALRAYHRGWIVIRDPALAGLRVNAVLDLKSPERALRTLARGLPIRVSTLSPFVILVAPR